MSTGFNLSSVFATVAAAVPEQEVLVHGDLRLTYAQVQAHADGFARFLASRGLGCHTERDDLAGHESGQDHVGLYLYNGPEYLEAMIASYRARAVPINVNYRYVAEELAYLLVDAGTRALVYHSCFAEQVADQVVFIDGGVVVEQGPPGQVIGDPSAERTRRFLERILNIG